MTLQLSRPLVENKAEKIMPEIGSPSVDELQSCPACGENEHTNLKPYCHENWTIARCSNCRFVYLSNPPGYQALESEFAWEHTALKENARRLDTRPIIASVSRLSRWRLGVFGRSFDKVAKHFPTGNILDIGCGAGHMKIGENAIPHGIEVSKSLHASANKQMGKRGGYAIHAPASEGIAHFEDGYFRGVIMFSYLEHEQQPRKILREVFRVLEPGGKAYVRVPNFGSINRIVMQKNWCGFRYPDHINYFTLKSLKRMAATAGFKTSLLNKGSLIFDDNISIILEKQ